MVVSTFQRTTSTTFTFLILGQVFASSVTPFVVAINSPEAAKANISLRMSVRSSYFTGDIGTFTNELVSLLSEKKDQVLLLNASEGTYVLTQFVHVVLCILFGLKLLLPVWKTCSTCLEISMLLCWS